MMSRGPETSIALKKMKISLKLKELKPLYKIYMKNGIAYTEDHIPVRKLHLFSMPMELTQDALLDDFTQNYGQVLGIERIKSSVPAKEDEEEYLLSWNAFALFADVRDAAKVLKSWERVVNCYKFYVQASYSWLQPVDDEVSNELEFATSPPILKLNDDCLEYVFQYLSFVDQIRLARTGTRFQAIYQIVSARQHKSVDDEISKGLTLWETRDFCQLSGKHVEDVTCSQWKSDENRYFVRCFFAGFHFPNLKKLVVIDDKLKVRKLQRILLGTTKLNDLMLWTKPRTNRLDLAHLTELKKLHISHWNTEALSLPTSIEVLILHEWNKFSCLPSILGDHSQIKKLKIVNCQANIFKEMARSQAFSSVEVFDLIHNASYGKELFTQLPNLKKLRLCYLEEFPNLNELNSHQLDNLEIHGNLRVKKEWILQITSLIGLQTLFLKYSTEIDDDIISGFGKLKELRRLGLFCHNITESTVLQLLKNCPKLSTLRMRDCRNVTDSLVHSINSLVQEAKHCGENQRELPITLQFTNKTEIKSTYPDVVVVYVNRSKEFSDCFEKLVYFP